jgi:hypothetical protein
MTQGASLIFQQVRNLLGSEPTTLDANHVDIKRRLIELGGGSSFPHGCADDYIVGRIWDLAIMHGQLAVVESLDELRSELRDIGLELPDFYRIDRSDSLIQTALDLVPTRREAQSKEDAVRAACRRVEQRRKAWLLTYLR